MYKQADVTSGHTTIPELQNDVTSPNALPTAAMLAAIGGVAGLGGSLLSKKQRKHKLRNTLLGATALPALFLAADKWGTDKMRSETRTIKSRVNHDLLPQNMVSFFGGWNEHAIGNAPTIRNAYDTTRGRLSDKEEELQSVKNTPTRSSSEAYRTNEQNIADYSEGGKQVNKVQSDFGDVEKAVNTRKGEAVKQQAAARAQAEKEHGVKVDAAKKQLQQLKDQDDIDVLERYEAAYPDIKDNPEWNAYKRLYQGKTSAEGKARAAFGDTDRAILTVRNEDLANYNKALADIEAGKTAANPYKAELDAADKKVKDLTDQIKNFTKSDEYNDIARRERLRLLGLHTATAYNDEAVFNQEVQAATKKAVDARIKELNQALAAAKKAYNTTNTAYNKAGWDQWWDSWDFGRKQKNIEKRIEEITSEIQDLRARETAANNAKDRVARRFKELLTTQGLSGQNDSLSDFLKKHEEAKKEQQDIIESKPNYSGIGSAYAKAVGDADTDLINAQIARDMALADIATKLKQFQDQKSTWDAEDTNRQNRLNALGTEINSTIPESLQQDVDNYDNALRNNRENMANTQNQLLAATGGGAGLIVLLSALNKLRKRKQKEISPEEYINYLEEEGLA